MLVTASLCVFCLLLLFVALLVGFGSREKHFSSSLFTNKNIIVYDVCAEELLAQRCVVDKEEK